MHPSLKLHHVGKKYTISHRQKTTSPLPPQSLRFVFFVSFVDNSSPPRFAFHVSRFAFPPPSSHRQNHLLIRRQGSRLLKRRPTPGFISATISRNWFSPCPFVPRPRIRQHMSRCAISPPPVARPHRHNPESSANSLISAKIGTSFCIVTNIIPTTTPPSRATSINNRGSTTRWLNHPKYPTANPHRRSHRSQPCPHAAPPPPMLATPPPPEYPPAPPGHTFNLRILIHAQIIRIKPPSRPHQCMLPRNIPPCGLHPPRYRMNEGSRPPPPRPTCYSYGRCQPP